MVLLYWVVLTGNNQPTNPTAPPKPAPDDIAQLIAKCGKPDRDVTTPAKLPKVPERRWLLYKSKNITATFDRAPHQGRQICDGESIHLQQIATTFNERLATGSISIS